MNILYMQHLLMLLLVLATSSVQGVSVFLYVLTLNKLRLVYCLSESVSGLDQVEQTSQQKPNSVESDCCQDGKQ